MRSILILLCILPLPLMAQDTCDAAPSQVVRSADLMERLKGTDTEAAARVVSDALWEVWLTAPDARAQELLDTGMARREMFDFARAETILDRLVVYCPDYAEGWNQRAFVRFLRRDFENALDDLDRALGLNPGHLGALSGKALTLAGLGREDEAFDVLRAALALNPWLPERAMLEGLGTEL